MVQDYRNLTRLDMEQLDRKETIVLIPVTSLEQHGNHCPLGTDAMIAEGTIRRMRAALPEEVNVLLFPALPLGLSTEHVNFCGSITLTPRTLLTVLSRCV